MLLRAQLWGKGSGYYPKKNAGGKIGHDKGMFQAYPNLKSKPQVGPTLMQKIERSR